MPLLDKLRALLAEADAEGGEGDADPTPDPAPDAAPEEDAPAWAKALIDRVDKLEAAGESSPPADNGKDEPAPKPKAGAGPPARNLPPKGKWTAQQIEAMSEDQIIDNLDSIERQWREEVR